MKAVIALNKRCEVVTRPIPTTVADRQVLLKVHCTALNRADCMQRKGAYPPPPGATDVLGLEAAGVVVSRGNNCSSKFGPGSRVMALLPGGGYAEYALVDERHLMPIPPTWDFVRAAAVPEVWLTAFQLLFLVGKVQPGERVLVHAGGSGVGTALCQLARQAGCQVFATASAGKLEAAKEAGAHFTLDRSRDWASDLLGLKQGGVSLVLDPVGGAEYSERNCQVCDMDARWVLFGLLAGGGVCANLFPLILRKRLQVIGTTLRSRSDDYKAELVSEFVKRGMLDRLTSGELRPVLDAKSFSSLDEVQEALDYMETDKSVGKVVLRVVADS
jgi:tumor protein p53-inducible protein 3